MHKVYNILSMIVVGWLCLVSGVPSTDGMWEKLQTKGVGPLPRESFAAVAFGNSIYTFGGFFEDVDRTPPDENVFYNDVWKFNTGSKKWEHIVTLPDLATGEYPYPRAFCLYGRHNNDLVIGFGINYNGASRVLLNDIWALNTKTLRWKVIRANGTTSDSGPGPLAAIDSVIHEGVAYIYGGIGSNFRDRNDTWTFDLETGVWNLLDNGPRPSSRHSSAIALDPIKERMYLYGGEVNQFTSTGLRFVFPSSDPYWYLDLRTLQWIEVSPSATPAERNNGNGAAYADGKFLLFGGDVLSLTKVCNNTDTRQYVVDETWTWNTEINSWVQICSIENPPKLKRAVTVSIGPNVYLLGGWATDSETCGPVVRPTDVWHLTISGCYGGEPCGKL